jgi:hypothetical protein
LALDERHVGLTHAEGVHAPLVLPLFSNCDLLVGNVNADNVAGAAN